MNHRDGEIEKGQEHYEATDNGYGHQTTLGAGDAVVGGTGAGEMHRGLKSRHIQFLYVAHSKPSSL